MKKTISALLICIVASILFGCQDHTGEAKTPSASSIQHGKDYQDVIQEFQKKGFKNIKTNTIDDLIFGWLTKDGEVENVTVDGNEDYSPDVWYPENVEVVITYHTFPNTTDSPKTTESTPNPSKIDETVEVASNVTSTETQAPPGDNDEQNINFPKELALRAAIVAFTNGCASDVFSEDGNHRDSNKFHSYADVTGEFFNLVSEGRWSIKNENTYHVEKLTLKFYNHDTVLNANCDVAFDGSNYKINNITGTFALPGKEQYGTNLNYMETDSDNQYLIVSPDFIAEDRNQADADSRTPSKILDKYVAREAFEQYGSKLFPYGFKCHWAIDLKYETQADDGTYTIKVGVTIKNQYGTKRDAVAEGVVKGTTNNPIIESFDVY